MSTYLRESGRVSNYQLGRVDLTDKPEHAPIGKGRKDPRSEAEYTASLAAETALSLRRDPTRWAWASIAPTSTLDRGRTTAA